MKKLFYFLLAVLAANATSFAAKIPSAVIKEINISAHPQASMLIQQTKAAPNYAVSALTIHDLQQALGRKLSLKEKISWHFYKKHLQAEEPTERAVKKANSNAVLGFVFSIAGLLIFPLFAIPALILSLNALSADKVNPGILTNGNRGLASAGKIISYIEFALIFIVLVIVAAYFAALH